MSPMFGVFFVSVKRESTDMVAVKTSVDQYAPYVFRHIFQIPLVDKAVDLADKLKQEHGEEVILFNLSGHGLIELQTYDMFLNGEL